MRNIEELYTKTLYNKTTRADLSLISVESLDKWNTDLRDLSQEYNLASAQFALESINKTSMINTLKTINNDIFSHVDRDMYKGIESYVRSLEADEGTASDNSNVSEGPNASPENKTTTVSSKKSDLLKSLSENIQKVIKTVVEKITSVKEQMVDFFNEKNREIFLKTMAKVQEKPEIHEDLAKKMQSKIDSKVLNKSMEVAKLFNGDIYSAMDKIVEFYKELGGIVNDYTNKIIAAMGKEDDTSSDEIKSILNEASVKKAIEKLGQIDGFNPTIYWVSESSKDNKLSFDNNHLSEAGYMRLVNFSNSITDTFKSYADKISVFVKTISQSSNAAGQTAAKPFIDFLNKIVMVGPSISSNTGIQLMKVLGWVQSEFAKQAASKAGNTVKNKAGDVKNKFNKQKEEQQ